MKKTVFIVWFFCLINFIIIDAKEVCNGNFYLRPCDNGKCVESHRYCDGTIDCLDGSDETGEHCLQRLCPDFSFQCTYGACINATKQCDGKIDCADKSDENAYLCRYPIKDKAVGSNFQCDYGEIIDYSKLCDGKRDCVDGSDETIVPCASSYCSYLQFRCAYGACIEKTKACDGVIDCADGADEYKSICGQNHTVSRFVASQDSCQVPHIPNLLVIFNSTVEEILKPESYVDQFITIYYKCNPGNRLDGTNSNFCFRGKWMSEQPKCIKYCLGDDLKAVTISATCYYNNVRISCDQPLNEGTIAKLDCEVGYKKPDRTVSETLYCDEFGKWGDKPYRCDPLCGIEQREGVPFIIGGEKVNITTVPWHAGIYSSSKGSYEQICGGTILNANVIVSAAHCFWDETRRTTVNPSYILVAVGKNFRGFLANEPLLSQYINVSEIHLAEGYQDSLQAYQNDIAILILRESIKFKPYIKPICLEWLNYSEKSIKTGVRGRIAGWGKTGIEMISSNELRMLETPAVSYSDCLDKIDARFRTELASDKFCLAAVDEETICEGDSGGGFVVPKIINGINVYYLWGVVSNGLTERGNCRGDFYTALTNVQHHWAMISEYEAKYRPK